MGLGRGRRARRPGPGPPRPSPPPRHSRPGAKVLIVDDDVRNVFALTSLLESFDVAVSYALEGAAGVTRCT